MNNFLRMCLNIITQIGPYLVVLLLLKYLVNRSPSERCTLTRMFMPLKSLPCPLTTAFTFTMPLSSTSGLIS